MAARGVVLEGHLAGLIVLPYLRHPRRSLHQRFLSPLAPRGLRDFVDMVVPELQRRGAFRSAYQSTTLRGHLGLAIPVNHHFQSSR
jgi:hypothetical protein